MDAQIDALLTQCEEQASALIGAEVDGAELASTFMGLTKQFYDHFATYPHTTPPMPELITEGLHFEQVWSQIEMSNDSLKEVVDEIAERTAEEEGQEMSDMDEGQYITGETDDEEEEDEGEIDPELLSTDEEDNGMEVEGGAEGEEDGIIDLDQIDLEKVLDGFDAMEEMEPEDDDDEDDYLMKGAGAE
ncbi:U3 small nucleolar ribonucleoprotein complex, subunit Mpp10, partial [Kipferlia bialata]|eukprot:g5040.t1